MRTSVLCLLAFAACEPPKPVREDAVVVHENKLATIRKHVPEGWSSAYDAIHDVWLFTRSTSSVRFERAPAPAVASPEALRHYLQAKVWPPGTTAEIESRASLSDGYATTLVVHAAADPAHPTRETHVIKQLGNEWFRCLGAPIVDDAMRDQVLALCKSLKR